MIPLLVAAILLQDPTVEQLIEKLASDNIVEREKAAAKLTALGRTALPALEAAAQSKDAEVASRAEQILKPVRAQIAKETLLALEAKIGASAQLRIRFTAHFEKNDLETLQKKGKGGAEDVEGEFRLKAPQKIHAVLRIKGSSSAEPRAMVSDGEFFATRRQGGPWNNRSAPADLKGKLTGALVRTGLGYWWTATEGFMVRDPRSEFELSDVRPGAPEGSESTILYKLSDREHLATLESKLWVESKTGKLVKRTLVGEFHDSKWSSTETYEEFSVDAEIPDDVFKLPVDKK